MTEATHLSLNVIDKVLHVEIVVVSRQTLRDVLVDEILRLSVTNECNLPL